MQLTEEEALAMFLILKACIVENDIEGARHYMRQYKGSLKNVITFASKLYDTMPYNYSKPELIGKVIATIQVIDPETGEPRESCECSMCTNNTELKVNEAHTGE